MPNRRRIEALTYLERRMGGSISIQSPRSGDDSSVSSLASIRSRSNSSEPEEANSRQRRRREVERLRSRTRSRSPFRIAPSDDENENRSNRSADRSQSHSDSDSVSLLSLSSVNSDSIPSRSRFHNLRRTSSRSSEVSSASSILDSFSRRQRSPSSSSSNHIATPPRPPINLISSSSSSSLSSSSSSESESTQSSVRLGASARISGNSSEASLQSLNSSNSSTVPPNRALSQLRQISNLIAEASRMSAAVVGRRGTRSRSRIDLSIDMVSSSDSDSDVEVVSLRESPPPARAVRRGRGRPSLVTSTRGRRAARGTGTRAARIQASVPVLPREPVTTPPPAAPSPRPPPRVRRAVPRGGRRPAAQARRFSSPPPPPTPPRRNPDPLPAVPAVDPPGPPRAPLPIANEPMAAVKGSFECVVCMENLLAPATIMENNNPPANNAVANPGMVGMGDFPEMERVFAINLIAEMNEVMGNQIVFANIPPRPRRRSAVNLAQINPRDIMTTPCGHMYHVYCIQKWFTEQGRKTCPSCRKSVTGKVIKLFPSITEEPDVGVRAEEVPAAPAPEGANVNNPNQNAQVDPREINVDAPCGNPSCQDMRMLQQLLQGDNRDLQQRVNEANEARAGMTENLDVLQAQVDSLEEDNNRMRRRIAELENAAEVSEMSSKRRRHK